MLTSGVCACVFGASGFVEPMHRVPHNLVELYKFKLADMESQGVIEKVDYLTDFVNNLVITHKKNGSIRICLDPKHRNQQIRLEHFPIPNFSSMLLLSLGIRKFSQSLISKTLILANPVR